MQAGILLALLSYFAFSCADAAMKALGDDLSIFEIGFYVSLFAMLPALLTKRPGDNWRNVFAPSRPKLVLLRMASGTLGNILAVIAFTSLPLAEAYALIFLLPALVTVLSWLILKEEIGWRRWSAVAVGFLGVLIVVRPGFREILPGHFAAVGVALFGAFNVIVLRVLGPSERRITLIGAALVGSILVNGVLMIPGHAGPSLDLLPLIVFGGLCMGLGHLLIVFATRLAPANRVAPTQYGQILWATLIGALFFDEFPDAFSIAGMGLVVFSGLFTFLREEKRTGWWQRTPLLRNRG